MKQKEKKPKKKNTVATGDCEKKLSIATKNADSLQEELRLHQWIAVLHDQHLTGCLKYTGEITNDDLQYADKLRRRMLNFAKQKPLTA